LALVADNLGDLLIANDEVLLTAARWPRLVERQRETVGGEGARLPACACCGQVGSLRRRTCGEEPPAPADTYQQQEQQQAAARQVLFAVDKDVDGALLRGVRPGSKLYRTTYAVRETGSTTRGLNVETRMMD
jgi:hypothetical protein